MIEYRDDFKRGGPPTEADYQKRGGAVHPEVWRQRLERAGWAVGTAAEFLDLTPEEAAAVAAKLDKVARPTAAIETDPGPSDRAQTKCPK